MMQPQRRFRQSLISETCSLPRCTNPRPQATVAIRFCMDVPNIGGLLVWNLLCVTLLAPRILRQLLGFWKICMILLTSYWGTGKIVVILPLFSSGSMYEKRVSESFMRPLQASSSDLLRMFLFSVSGIPWPFLSVTLPPGEGGNNEKHLFFNVS